MAVARSSAWAWFALAQYAVRELGSRLVMAEREAKCAQVKARQHRHSRSRKLSILASTA